MLILLLVYWRDLLNQIKQFSLSSTVALMVIAMCGLWALILNVENNFQDTTQISRFFHFFLYSIVGGIVFSRLCRYNLHQLIISIGAATLIQAFFIFYSFSSPIFREWLHGNLVQGGNIDFLDRYRVSGFSNSSGADLSLIQSIGVLCLLSASLKSKTMSASLFLFSAAIVTLASVFPVGRTGLMVGIAGFVGYTSYSVFSKRGVIRVLCQTTLLLALVLVFYPFAHNFYFENSGVLDYVMTWAFEVFSASESGSVIQIMSMKIPDLSIDTLLGTGLVANADGRNASGHDSGYVQIYYAIGMPVALIFYTAFSVFFSAYAIKQQLYWVWWAILLMLFVEIKEPFIFKYILPFSVYAAILCETNMRGGFNLQVKKARRDTACNQKSPAEPFRRTLEPEPLGQGFSYQVTSSSSS